MSGSDRENSDRENSDRENSDSGNSGSGNSGRANPAQPETTVTVRRVSGHVVITVVGEIDLVTAPRLEDAVRKCLTERPAVLVIDLDQASFFSSAGIAVLVLAHRATPLVDLRVVAHNQVVLRPLELTGLTHDLAIHPTLQSALAA